MLREISDQEVEHRLDTEVPPALPRRKAKPRAGRPRTPRWRCEHCERTAANPDVLCLPVICP